MWISVEGKGKFSELPLEARRNVKDWINLVPVSSVISMIYFYDLLKFILRMDNTISYKTCMIY